MLRYGRHRAMHPADLRWAQRAFDTIAQLLSDPPAATGVAPLRRTAPATAPNASDGPRLSTGR